MKVLYVFCAEEASGAEIVIKRLMEHNVQHVEPHLFIAPGSFANDLIDKRESNVHITNYLKRINRKKNGTFKLLFIILQNYFFLSFKVLRYIKKHDIKVVHGNTLAPSSYLIPAITISKLFFFKVRWIWSEHDLSYQSNLENRLSGYCGKRFDLTLAVSLAVKRNHPDNDRVKLLYNGLETDKFIRNAQLRLKFRTAYNIKSETIVIGIAGTVYPRKGQLGLVNAVKKLNVRQKDVVLLVAGSIPEGIREYGENVLKLADGERIRYIGVIRDMISFYNGCDIIVNNSSNNGSEPLGTTIYEAMACENIVVASDTGGSPEILIDGESGFLFKADDESALTEILNKILANFDDMAKVRENGRARAKEIFDINTMTTNYNKILTELI